MSHLCPFGITAYAYIPLELNSSKLYPRSVKVSLLGYFGRNRYKLLEKSTGTVFRSWDVIFKGVTHFVKQPSSVIFPNDDNPFSYTPSHTETRSDEIVTPQKILTPLHHEIASRPLPITDLHKDKTTTNSGTLPHLPPSDTLRNLDTTALQKDTDLPLAIRRPRRDLKPSTQLRELHEYLNQPCTFIADIDSWVPKAFNDTMKWPDLWWEPMMKEFEMLKEQGVFKLVPRPEGKNIVRSKWVYAVK